jgi:hypothetical protein
MVKRSQLPEEYEVERILGKRLEAGRALYRVKWAGYREEESTWEPLEHLEECRDLVLAFDQQQRPKPRVAMKIPRAPGSRPQPSEDTLELEDWNLIVDPEPKPKSSLKRLLKKPKSGVLGVDKPKKITKRWKEQGEWRFEVKWGGKRGKKLLNSEVTVKELREKEPKMLLEYLVREVR